MKCVSLILTAASLAVTAGACLADASADAKRSIQASTDKAMQLIVKHQYEGLAKLCTPDCKFTEAGQTMGLKESLATLKAEMAVTKDVKMSSTVLTCKVNGDTAECTSRDVMSAKVKGPDKKWHTLNTDGTSRQTFVKKGGKWLMKSNASVTQKTLQDGKPFNPAEQRGTGGSPEK